MAVNNDDFERMQKRKKDNEELARKIKVGAILLKYYRQQGQMPAFLDFLEYVEPTMTKADRQLFGLVS